MSDWSPEDVAALREMHARGLRGRAIGRILGRSECAVNSKRSRLGLYTFQPRTCLKVSIIQQAVADAFGVPMRELLSERRGCGVAQARQVAMYLCRELTHNSYPFLGRHFDRDHTTVLYGVNVIEERLKSDPKLREAVESIRESLKSVDRSALSVCRSNPPESLEYPMEQNKILEAA